jgi:glycosyltransferase involved in cell wall biosynthesis
MVMFEVRIPAFEHSAMLLRAVRSLEAQTYPHWRAVVFDDSRSSAVQEIIARRTSKNILWMRNSEHLGAARNIDQCFSRPSQFNGDYACLLEGDNYWLPRFLELIVESLSKRPTPLILANQRIHEEGKGLRSPGETTRGRWFDPGVIEPLTLRASLFFMEGVSNGGLVWKLNSDVNMHVDAEVRETGLHEACRSLLLSQPFVFIVEAEAVWSQRPKSHTARSQESNRAINRGMQSIRKFVLSTNGPQVVRRAKNFVADSTLADRLVENLSYAGKPLLAGDLLRGRTLLATRSLFKGSVVRAVQPDPCASFLKRLRQTVSARSLSDKIAGSHSFPYDS